MAPFWADFDSETQGSVFYRATNDSSIMHEIATMISSINSEYSHYMPRQALIATWEDIVPFKDAERFTFPSFARFVSIMTIISH